MRTPSLDVNFARRMRLQDEGVMFVLLLLYFITLLFSASFAFRQVTNNSRILFYADP
eukprot:CAMPEP_0117542068 /NCGR_PEP_ID=MMETSP0784-20121206/44345_1 /TAXON_ID=39447 /ORGANISM="" /LENGTH=56 /DNA_ID=CAMNT_0005338785 /DNA_START=18 /DNA_END=184 /DNA_ORIENTATION=-